MSASEPLSGTISLRLENRARAVKEQAATLAKQRCIANTAPDPSNRRIVRDSAFVRAVLLDLCDAPEAILETKKHSEAKDSDLFTDSCLDEICAFKRELLEQLNAFLLAGMTMAEALSGALASLRKTLESLEGSSLRDKFRNHFAV